MSWLSSESLAFIKFKYELFKSNYVYLSGNKYLKIVDNFSILYTGNTIFKGQGIGMIMVRLAHGS